MIVSVAVQRSCGILGIVVISQENIGSLCDELADAVFVRIKDLNVNTDSGDACSGILEINVSVKG